MSLTFTSQTFTRFTDPTASAGSDKNLVFSADKWARVSLTLQTVGPVIVGTQATLDPTQPGQGILLTPNVPYSLTLPPGNRLYMVSASINRVAVVIEPYPWLEQIVGLLCRAVGIGK